MPFDEPPQSPRSAAMVISRYRDPDYSYECGCILREEPKWREGMVLSLHARPGTLNPFIPSRIYVNLPCTFCHVLGVMVQSRGTRGEHMDEHEDGQQDQQRWTSTNNQFSSAGADRFQRRNRRSSQRHQRSARRSGGIKANNPGFGSVDSSRAPNLLPASLSTHPGGSVARHEGSVYPEDHHCRAFCPHASHTQATAQPWTASMDANRPGAAFLATPFHSQTLFGTPSVPQSVPSPASQQLLNFINGSSMSLSSENPSSLSYFEERVTVEQEYINVSATPGAGVAMSYGLQRSCDVSTTLIHNRGGHS